MNAPNSRSGQLIGCHETMTCVVGRTWASEAARSRSMHVSMERPASTGVVLACSAVFSPPRMLHPAPECAATMTRPRSIGGHGSEALGGLVEEVVEVEPGPRGAGVAHRVRVDRARRGDEQRRHLPRLHQVGDDAADVALRPAAHPAVLDALGVVAVEEDQHGQRLPRQLRGLPVHEDAAHPAPLGACARRCRRSRSRSSCRRARARTRRGRSPCGPAEAAARDGSAAGCAGSAAAASASGRALTHGCGTAGGHAEGAEGGRARSHPCVIAGLARSGQSLPPFLPRHLEWGARIRGDAPYHGRSRGWGRRP